MLLSYHSFHLEPSDRALRLDGLASVPTMTLWTITSSCHAFQFVGILLAGNANGWNLIPKTAERRSLGLFHSTVLISSPVIAPRFIFHCSISNDLPLEEDLYPTSDFFEGIDIEKTDEGVSMLMPGLPSGFSVVHQYNATHRFALDKFDPKEISRLELSPENVSLPVALMLLDSKEFPSLSKARKVCRKGNILIHRRPLPVDNSDSFDLENCIIGRVGGRVFPGDVVAKQLRIGNGHYPNMSFRQPFELDVVYEDDHFAIVNKPAGIVVHAHKQSGYGTMTIQCCLPFVLTPPRIGTLAVLRRPQPVHRLDKPTSGLLLVAKTKPAMQHLGRQFLDRRIKKTYTAIVNGIPFESVEGAISSRVAAQEIGVDVDPESEDVWQMIHNSLDEKEAVTLWCSRRFTPSLKANDKTLTTVELKPKTGRFHQLRRHMALVCHTPLVGDNDYDGGGAAIALRGRGLFLCANRVTLEHPYYNTEEGRLDWDRISQQQRLDRRLAIVDGKIMVSANIDLPNKFESFLSHEQNRIDKHD